MADDQKQEQPAILTADLRAALIEKGIKIACNELRGMQENCKDELGAAYLKEAAQQIHFNHLRKKIRDERRLNGGE